MSVSTALIIPTRNSAPFLSVLQSALQRQSLSLDEILIIDSSSVDGSADQWRKWGARVETVEPRTFNHGGTRGLASRMVKSDVLIYMTQDAIPEAADSLQQIRDALFLENDIGTAFGRQLPHVNAGLLAQHSRAYNYPAQSLTKRMSDAPNLGIKTCFSSDAFAAYRHDVLDEVGGFPEDVIGTEDAHVAGRMLLAGYAVRYAAEARVRHSHDYTVMEEFRRYFDIGVFYGR